MDKIKAQIFEVLKTMASAYGKDSITQNRLLIYTEVLTQKLTPEEIRSSLNLVLETCEQFPSIAKIIELTKGSDQSNAVDASAKVIKAISDFGTYQGKEAMQELGPLWSIVEGVGGWKYLCSLTNDELGILRAQMRELAKAKIMNQKISSSKLIGNKGDTFSITKNEEQSESKLNPLMFQGEFRISEELSSLEMNRAGKVSYQKSREGGTL